MVPSPGKYSNLFLGVLSTSIKAMSTTNTQGEPVTQQTLDNAKLEQLIRENTELTKSMHRVLMGEPEYKRAGLVEIVDRHERIYIRGGVAFTIFYGIWELIKYFHPHIG
jgi:hypothetical protein